MAKQPTTCAECGTALLRELWHPTKKRPILASYCNHACKAAWQRRQKPVDKEWLIQKYVVDGLNCVQIAKMVGRDQKGVWNWLKGYGIKTRPRGSDLERQWKDGEREHPGGFPHTEETKEKQRQRRLADGHYPKQPNGLPYWKGKRGEQHPNWQGGITPDRPALSASDEWKEAVKAVWSRADAKCERCGRDHREVDNRSKDGFHIHHIIPFRFKQYRTVVTNLVLLCRPCHNFVHSRKNTAKEFINAPDR